MNNYGQYESLSDYSSQLNQSIKSIEHALWYKKPKQMGSLMVTLQNLQNTLYNIIQVQNMMNQFAKLPTMDSKAKRDNKYARKASDEIISINQELAKIYLKLKKDLFKQFEVAKNQYYDVIHVIKDPEERKRFEEASNDFRRMAYEAKSHASRIPFNKKGFSLIDEKEQARTEHSIEERKLNERIKFQKDKSESLTSALNTLTSILALSDSDSLVSEVRKEVAQIKKAVPPKTLSVTKDLLEYLRHSSHLLLDLEQISEIMGTTYSFCGKNGKLKKLKKRLKNLKPLLERAITEENERKQELNQTQNAVQNKIDYATRAVNVYSDMLDKNNRLQQEQNKILYRTHHLYGVNEELEEDAAKATAEAQTSSTRSEELYERARKDIEAIKENEAYMDRKMNQSKVTTLPSDYTRMKKRLDDMSALHESTLKSISKGGRLK